jgi:hypothetical protein
MKEKDTEEGEKRGSGGERGRWGSMVIGNRYDKKGRVPKEYAQWKETNGHSLNFVTNLASLPPSHRLWLPVQRQTDTASAALQAWSTSADP